MNYKTWKKQADALDAALYSAAIAYRRFNEHRDASGLLPNAIMAGESYKEIDGQYLKVFNKLWAHNSVKGSKEFKQKRAIERKEKRFYGLYVYQH